MKLNNKLQLFGLATGMTFSLAPVTPLFAEQLVLEEVFVTAQKRDESALDVPITVDVFSPQNIENTGALNLADIDEFIPGFEFEDGNLTQAGATLRGVSRPNISAGGDPSVAIFYDDVYLPRAASTVTFSDIASVEVLKGPQGTLFGRNAAAGVVQMQPNPPQEDFDAFVSTRLGNFDLQRVEAMVNVPLSDSFFLRANVLSNRRDGIAENIGSGRGEPGEKDNQAARLAVLWQPSANTDLQLSYDWDKIDQAPPQAFGISEFAFSNDPFVEKVANDVIDGEETRDMYTVTAKLRHQFATGLSLKFVTSYRDFETTNREDEDGTADITRYFDTNNIEDSDIFYNELQFNFTNDFFNLVFGANYSKEDTFQSTDATALADSIARLVTGELNNQLRDLGASPLIPDHYWNADEFAATLNGAGLANGITEADILASGDFEYERISTLVGDRTVFGPSFAGQTWTESIINEGDFTNWGIYADIDLSISDRLNILAGIRYSKDKKTFSWFTPLPSFNTLRPGVIQQIFPVRQGFEAAIDAPVEASDEWSKTTGRLVAKYQLTDSLMTYLSYSTGYKSGGFDSLDVSSSVEPFEPEEATNIEWGIKGDFFGKRLRTQVSVFDFELENRQKSVETRPPDRQNSLPTVINGDQEIQGVELTLQWLATESLLIGLVTTYRDEKSQFEPFFNADAVLQEDEESNNADNNYTLSLDWTPAIELGDFLLHVEYVFREESQIDEPDFVEALETIPHIDDDKKLLNARLAWTNSTDNLTVALWSKNLLDNDYISSVRNITRSSFGTSFVRIDDPLTWGVEAQYRF